MNRQGKFVISLDFELIYGVSHLDDQPYWEENVLGGRNALKQILNLFREHDIHATWAAVGMLMADDKEEMVSFFPGQKPKYEKNNYDLTRIGHNEAEDPLRYGGSLLELVRKTPHQEIGTHTFSHFYCMQEGQSKEDFMADIHAAMDMAEKKGITLKSIVFPKNQVDPSYLELLRGTGLRAFRGNERFWLYEEKGKEGLVKRGLRLLDAYWNISGMNCYDADALDVVSGIVNVPSSRFLRPYMPKLRVLEGCKIKRIQKQMRYAAKNGKIFHLWWHPHNFGRNTEKNMENLKKILDYYELLREQYGFESVNMTEIAEMRL